MVLLQNLNSDVSRIASALGIPAVSLPTLSSHTEDFSMEGYDCAFIKGDNLAVLSRLLENSENRVNFCYIDPPYNTGQSFAYSDSRLDGQSPVWGTHGNWMAFMLPRLVLLRALLAEDGILAISIDDYEYARLKIVLDCVFGEINHVATLVVTRSKNGKGSKAGVSVNHEYVLLYSQSRLGSLLGLPETQIEEYDKNDAHGWYKVDGLFRKKGDDSRREDRPKMFYPLYYDNLGNVYTENLTGELKTALPIDTSGVQRRWLWGMEKARSESWKLYASKGGVIYVKNYLTEGKRIKVRSTWDDVRYLTEKATNEIKDIFGEKIFETPKPIALIEDLIECCVKKDGLILDHFAGTGTTAHAAHLVNIKDKGSRQVILVEQNLPIPQKHIAHSCGFSTLANITEGRLLHVQSKFPSYVFKTYDWS